MKFPGVALLVPGRPGGLLERRLENRKLSFLVEMALHVGDVRMVATIALLLVKELEEHLQ